MSTIWTWVRANPIGAALGTIVVVLGIYIVVSAYFGHKDRKEQRIENVLVESGETRERLKANEEVLNNVEDANDAVRNPAPADVERMRERFDRARRSDGQ